MKNWKTILKKTPPLWLCVLGAVVFVLGFYTLAYRTPLQDVWLAPNMDNDEVIYNRQVVSVITHGGPQGYFGYDETHAALGRYGTWGPLLMWMYALPGFVFGAGVNTVFWCNLVFTAAGIALFAWAARLKIWQILAFVAALVCLWSPVDAGFTGGSEPLHYALTFLIVGASAALCRRGSRGWLAAALIACALETIFRPYALLFFAFPLVAVWKAPRRRGVCLGAAAVSFGAALFSMTQLSAPYFSSGGMDFAGLRLLLGGDPVGAVQYELERAGRELHTAWLSIVPTLQGDPQYVGVGCVAFLVLLLVVAACLVWDVRHGGPWRFKACALFCAGAIALVLVFMYNIAPRHLTLLCVLMLGALAVEDSRRAVVYLPVLALLVLPLNVQRSSLSTWFPEMGDQVTAVEQALTESQQAVQGDDPWDHTLAYAYDDGVFHGYLYGVPAGMGIEFDFNTYIADPANPVHSRYAMVGHGTDAEARLLADGWQALVSTQDLIVYERPDAAQE
ncbi:MAG: hypothetical protein ACLTWO_03930 [Blautia massiliensis (ex Durand et al. 2017)]